MFNPTRLTIRFDDKYRSPALLVDRDDPPADVLAALDLPPYEGIVVVHGGAGGMESELLHSVGHFLTEGLAPLAEKRRLLIVDGGTHAGVAQLLGEARETIGGTFPLVGIAPLHWVIYPDCPYYGAESSLLNYAHTHFVLVREGDFGVESDLLVGMLQAPPHRGAAVVINGGEIVLREVLAHVRHGNPLITIRKSGRIADQLADLTSPERRQLPLDTRLYVADVDAPGHFAQTLERLLFEPPHY